MASAPSVTGITGLILAGGAAQRMQTAHPGADKGLLPLADRPLVCWLIDNLKPQVEGLLISANRHLEEYGRLGLPVLTDRFPLLPGPLAGIHAALHICPTPWLAVAACDTPFLPANWVARLHAALQPARPGATLPHITRPSATPAPDGAAVPASSGFADRASSGQRPDPGPHPRPDDISPGPLIAFAEDPEQQHPLVALIHRSLLPSLDAALARGDHRVRQWFRQHHALVVRFDDPRSFFNINTPEAWHEAELLASSWQAPAPMNTAPDTPAPFLPSLSALCARQPGFDAGSVSLAQLQTVLAAYVTPLAETETLPLADTLQRILAAPLIAPFDLPPHDNAAMDGYALRHADLDASADTILPVAGRSLAGDAPATLPPGSAWRIFTGAAMPEGADTVVMQEDVEPAGGAGHDSPPRTTTAPPTASTSGAGLPRGTPTGQDTAAAPQVPRIRIPAGQRSGQNVRLRGEDLQAGSIALPAGRRLQAADIGVAASLGHDSLPVFRRLRVGVLSTGNELRQAGEQRQSGQIYDSNRHTLLAMVRGQGYQPVDLGALPDQPEAMRQALEDASRLVDVILSSGGAAGGDADLVRQVAASLGEAMDWKLRLRPGRPLVVGRIGRSLLLGLPGNPVAALLVCLVVVNDTLRRMAGAETRPVPRLQARSATAIKKRPGRTELLRVRLRPAEQPHLIAEVFGNQSSAMLGTVAHADGIAVLPENSGPVAAGDWIEVIPLHGLLPGGA